MMIYKRTQNNLKTILICSNYGWTIYNFRLPLIRKLKEEGFKVILATQFDGYEAKLDKEVDTLYNLHISRKGINVISDLVTFIHLFLILKRSKASLCLFFTIKPVIYGSLAARLIKIPSIPMITGLGTAFLKNNWLTSLVKILYKISLSSVSTIFFQNIDDKNLFLKNKLVSSEICQLSPGSGIEVDKFKPSPFIKIETFNFLFIGRMIKDKGIIEFVEAAKIVKASMPNTRFQLLGPLDVQNRTSISQNIMLKWVEEGIIEYLGETDDVPTYIKETNCVVLPSYREGTSRVLLEAASLERPIIATNVPGCREIVDDKVNGLLCSPRDSVDLANKMIEMTKFSNEYLINMGKMGRLKVIQDFDHKKVTELYLKAIKSNL